MNIDDLDQAIERGERPPQVSYLAGDVVGLCPLTPPPITIDEEWEEQQEKQWRGRIGE